MVKDRETVIPNLTPDGEDVTIVHRFTYIGRVAKGSMYVRKARKTDVRMKHY